MPLDYVIDTDRRMVLTTGTGIVTAAEAFDHQRRLKNDSNFQRDFCQVIDVTAVTSFNIDMEAIRQLSVTNIFAKHSRRAAVASSDLAVGLLRVMATHAELSGKHNEIRIFRDREEALRWLLPT